MYVMLLLYVELPLPDDELYDENELFWATVTAVPFAIVSPLVPPPPVLPEQADSTRAAAAATATSAPTRDFFNGPPVQGVCAPTTNNVRNVDTDRETISKPGALVKTTCENVTDP